MSSIRKITILLIISISLILFFLGSSVYYYLSNYSYADFYKRLEARVSVAEKRYFESNQRDAQVLKNIREEHLAFVVPYSSTQYRVLFAYSGSLTSWGSGFFALVVSTAMSGSFDIR